MMKQPIQTDEYLFTFNGDIFSNDNILKTESDTQKLFEKLSKPRDIELFSQILANQNGPFSLAFYSKPLRLLFFCRDFLGRNSLLMTRKNASQFIISSTLGKHSQKNMIQFKNITIQQI